MVQQWREISTCLSLSAGVSSLYVCPIDSNLMLFYYVGKRSRFFEVTMINFPSNEISRDWHFIHIFEWTLHLNDILIQFTIPPHNFNKNVVFSDQQIHRLAMMNCILMLIKNEMIFLLLSRAKFFFFQAVTQSQRLIAMDKDYKFTSFFHASFVYHLVVWSVAWKLICYLIMQICKVIRARFEEMEEQ